MLRYPAMRSHSSVLTHTSPLPVQHLPHSVHRKLFPLRARVKRSVSNMSGDNCCCCCALVLGGVADAGTCLLLASKRPFLCGGAVKGNWLGETTLPHNGNGLVLRASNCIVVKLRVKYVGITARAVPEEFCTRLKCSCHYDSVCLFRNCRHE